jgi:Phasin protein
MHDYNTKILEFAHANTTAAFDFFQKLADVRSPSEFVELSIEHARKYFQMLAEQTKELAAIAPKVTVGTAEPLSGEGKSPSTAGRDTARDEINTSMSESVARAKEGFIEVASKVKKSARTDWQA